MPGTTIKQQSVDTAIGHLHGEDFKSDDLTDAVELILLARAFGIPSLEVQASKTIEQQIEHSFKTIDLAAAVRELYEGFREEPQCAIGNDVVSVVTGMAARVCRKRMAVLRTDAAFMLLLKDFPQLALDILEAVADEDEGQGKEAKSEEQDSIIPQNSPQELLE